MTATLTFWGLRGWMWMDDLAVCVAVPTADHLPQIMGQVCGYLLDLCAFHCVSPNLSKGKTELQMVFRGAGSRRMKVQYYGPQAASTLPVLCERGVHHVQLVMQYQHLGGIVHHSADQRTELRHRAAIAHQTMTQHGRLIFRNKDIAFSKRQELFQMLVLTRFLYGAESWVAHDLATQKCFHTIVMKLYRRLGSVSKEEHLTDDDLLTRVSMPSPSELLRRARLRYISTLIHVGSREVWTMLACDDEWRGLLEEDFLWLWQQLRASSSLQDPREHYESWLFLIQTSPNYWKRLIRRACEHSIGQRAKFECVKKFHHRALQSLWTFLPFEECPQIEKANEVLAVYGCMSCQLRCQTKAGEAAHMCKRHGQVSVLRQLFDQPTCPACLKFYHSTVKLKAHLYYSENCRRRLQSHNMKCNIVPGGGSIEDGLRERAHDRLLPPLRSQGPLPAPVRQREVVHIHEGLYQRLVETATEAATGLEFKQLIAEYTQEDPMSWTQMRRTLAFFEDTLEEHDEEIIRCGLRDLRRQLQLLRDPEHWIFLQQNSVKVEKHMTIDELHAECLHFRECLRQLEIMPRPQAFGATRVVLHAFSGRRRRGDTQYYLDRLAQHSEGYILLVVSMDLVINPEYGDARNAATCDFWLRAIRNRWVIAGIAGPPCESWSIARGVQVPPLNHESAGGDKPCGPRVIRDRDQLWGFDGVTLRELRQLCVGNELLHFALLMVIELAISNGFALLEHPAEPVHDEQAASILAPPNSAGHSCIAPCGTCAILSGTHGS